MKRPDPRLSRRAVLRAGVAASLAGLTGCVGGGDGAATDPSTPRWTTSDATEAGGTDPAGSSSSPTATPAPTTASGSVTWRTTELTDVLTDEPFTVAQFEGTPVLVEFFAVWCPVCTDQQTEIGRLLDRREDVVAISLNVDPNEDAETVREHAREKRFDWRYAVAPTGVTRAFVEEFGTVVTSPPSAPAVRVCPDGSASLVGGRGVKSADELAETFGAC
jgi:cytochrome oxidase Cu insertion factor (SCO1/SenC/PrrC family)